MRHLVLFVCLVSSLTCQGATPPGSEFALFFVPGLPSLILWAIPLLMIILLGYSSTVYSLIENPKSRRDLWLSEQEKLKFMATHLHLSRAIHKKKDAVDWAERSNVSKNKDGQYSIRSNRGKEIRATINQSNATIDQSKRTISWLRSKPHRKWFELNIRLQLAVASLLGLGGFLLAALVALLFCKGLSVSNGFSFWKNVLAISAQTGLFSLVLGSVGILLFYRKPALVYFDEPPIVTTDNVNTWG